MPKLYRIAKPLFSFLFGDAVTKQKIGLAMRYSLAILVYTNFRFPGIVLSLCRELEPNSRTCDRGELLDNATNYRTAPVL